ncbi:hypothetical protein Ocin01_20009 [Orchesella cincta]|uniref:Protein sleepless n=1 Tax=Orchesella cincta TaxID=48709 RepID=A0A1D2M143_ORCCI|nr:hypothetical protein Ocin01_20009 [Orchesella cincta]
MCFADPWYSMLYLRKLSRSCDEHTCKPRHTLCAVAEYKSGKITRDCLSIDDKEEDEKVGTKCDEFNGDPPFRRCYCNTDLCNDNSLLKSGATTSDSGRAKGHYSVFIAVFVSAFVSGR